MNSNVFIPQVSIGFTFLCVLMLTGCSEKLPEAKAVASSVQSSSAVKASDPVAQVRPPQGNSDPERELVARVKSALSGDKALGNDGIEVTVSGNVAHLWGTVDSAAERKRAEALAGSVAGVTSVYNKLAVVTGS